MNHSGHAHHEHMAATAPPPPSSPHAHHHHHEPSGEAATHQHHGDHTMKMYFHGGFTEVILFDWWRIDSLRGLIFSILLIFIMGVAYEGVKWLRVYLESCVGYQRRVNVSTLLGNNSTLQNERIPLETADEATKDNGAGTQRADDTVYESTITRQSDARKNGGRVGRLVTLLDNRSSSSFSPFRLLQTALYIIQLTLAYWLMLIAMTYNTYLTAAVIFGAGVGHWIFAIAKQAPSTSTDGQVNAFASDVCH